MRSKDNVEETIKKKLSFTASVELHDRMLDEVLDTQEKSKKTKSAAFTPRIGRIIMKSPITKLAAAAAVIIVVVTIGVDQFSTNGSAIAWGNVAARAAKVDFVHFYELKCDQNGRS